MQRITEEIARIDGLGGTALRKAWGVHLGEPCPEVRSDRLLRIMLAGRLQEAAYGGLGFAARSTLRRLASRYEANPDYQPKGAVRLKPGTALTRIWQGARYEVRVADQGYLYQGKAYESLSEVAREITGARWSGPRFFGLKQSS